MYDGEVYNQDNPNAVTFNGWGENYCVDFDDGFLRAASSARFTGPPDGYKYSTLNLYQYDNYVGDEQYAYGDKPTLDKDNLGSSIIVTGCDAWTIYE